MKTWKNAMANRDLPGVPFLDSMSVWNSRFHKDLDHHLSGLDCHSATYNGTAALGQLLSKTETNTKNFYI